LYPLHPWINDPRRDPLPTLRTDYGYELDPRALIDHFDKALR
jgi:hypothetical protein